MNFLKNFDFYSAMSSLLYVIETFYFELTDGSYPTIPQGNCGQPWTKTSLFDSMLQDAVRSNVSMRIVNGQNAVPFSYPWTVSIRLKAFGYTHFCAGALIYSQYVLTAAHCVHNESASQFAVAVGVHATNQLRENSLYFVDKIQVHPLYIDDVAFYDIALIRLSKPVKMSTTVSTVCLPNLRSEADIVLGKNVALSGWGSTTGQMENEPEFLQQSLLTVVSLQQYCSQDFPLFDTAQMLCAIDPNPARSGNACTGDSGSPLVYLNHKRNDTFYLYGLTSFVLYDSVSPNAACDPTKPSYYVKVPSFLNWITKTILKMEKIPS